MWFAKSIADYLGISSFFLLLHIGLGGGGGEKKKREKSKYEDSSIPFSHHVKGYSGLGQGTESDKMTCMNELFCCHSLSQSYQFHIYLNVCVSHIWCVGNNWIISHITTAPSPSVSAALLQQHCGETPSFDPTNNTNNAV